MQERVTIQRQRVGKYSSCFMKLALSLHVSNGTMPQHIFYRLCLFGNLKLKIGAVPREKTN